MASCPRRRGTIGLGTAGDLRQVAAEDEVPDPLDTELLRCRGINARQQRIAAVLAQPIDGRGDLAVGMEEVVALPLPLLDRAREGVLRLQLEDAERAGLAVEDQRVEVGARLAAPLQFDAPRAQHEAPVVEEAIEILPEDRLAQMGAVVILLRVAAAQLARQEDQRLRRAARAPTRPAVGVKADQRRRRDPDDAPWYAAFPASSV